MRNGLPVSNHQHFQKPASSKGKRTWITPYGISNGGLHGMNCSCQWIMSLAWVILHGGLACASVLSTLCIVSYYHALVFLAHYVFFEISLTNSEAVSIQVNALNSTCRPMTLTWHDSSKPEILKIMTGHRSQNWWQLLSVSIWYQSLGWWWRWFNVSHNLFLTRMSHHLVESFDSMNYHWFKQCYFSNWVEQDVSYNRWCHQHCHLVVSWPSCLNYLLVEQAVVRFAAAIH